MVKNDYIKVRDILGNEVFRNKKTGICYSSSDLYTEEIFDFLIKKIKLVKKKLSKTKKENIKENFGQNYVRKFESDLSKIDATYSSKQRADKEIRDFDNWVMGFGGI